MLYLIMAEEERYSNRQIERLLDEQSKEIKAHMDLVAAPILAQTTKTNGRVLAAEGDIVGYKVWRGWITGGMAVIMVVLPIVVGLLTWMALQVVNFDNKIHTAIDSAFSENLQVNQ